MAFNIANVTLAVAASYEVFYWHLIRSWNSNVPVRELRGLLNISEEFGGGAFY